MGEEVLSVDSSAEPNQNYPNFSDCVRKSVKSLHLGGSPNLLELEVALCFVHELPHGRRVVLSVDSSADPYLKHN